MTSVGTRNNASSFRIKEIVDTIAAIELQTQTILGALGSLVVVAFYSDLLNYKISFFLAQNIFYGTAGIWVLKNARDQAAKIFGLFLLATSGAFWVGSLRILAIHLEILHQPIEALQQLHLDLLLGWFLWRFIEVYPSPVLSQRLRTFINAGKAASLISATIFIVFGIIHYIESLGIWRGVEGTPYGGLSLDITLRQIVDLAWSFLIPQVLLGVVFLLIRCQSSAPHERKKLRLFAAGFGVGFGIPMLGISLKALSPKYVALLEANSQLKTAETVIIQLALLTMPIVTSYAIMSHNALELRQIARSAIRYILAKYSATVIASIPFILLFVHIVQAREQTVQQLLSGTQGVVLVGLTVAGILLMRFRQSILDAIDKRFFREQYNARKVLTELADQVRGTRSLNEVSNLVGQGVSLALHPERSALLILDPNQGRFLDPLDEIRPLDTASKTAAVLQGSREALEVDFEDASSPLQDLEDEEKYWLIDNKIALLCPTHALDGKMIGILVLGRKKSDESFSREDKNLVRGVCSSTGLVIELLQLKERTPAPKVRRIARSTGEVVLLDEEESEQVAKECLACSQVYTRQEERCPKCKVKLDSTLVPYVLHGQYRFESRLGQGGMAVVYRATDLHLGREVAIKTLPRVSPEASMRLHREARTAATVSDLGLAAIYGIETWKGMPLLIQEYLRGGTLSDRLRRGETLNPKAAVNMGKVVALALQKIHSAGILHRDLKPSNIGYTQDGHAKLLDFGVARIQHDLRQDSEVGSSEPVDSKSRILNTQSWMVGPTATGQLVGTIGYLSPEAVLGLHPDPKVDLWALSVVLWEAMAGCNLFIGRNLQEILEKIRDVKIGDLREEVAECPQPVLDFFDRELHRDPSRRAASGREMFERLEALRLELEP